ncbi:DDE domain protein [Brucella lupini]|uniref:DDE domain protein n=1 Tax=Brucella lupini TaxID=255457 RepID=A0A256GFY0_9HYPH|nr:DDE domain protein [Brucella lupini]
MREWAEKFGQDYANTIRRRTPRLGGKWHLDEAVVTINGKRHFLWRAVDQDGFVLEVLVQKRRDTKAAKRFIRKLLSGQGAVPRVMVTDKLGSYGAANREIGLTLCDHRQHKGLNNRAENSHQPIRRRERGMKRFKSARHLQCFASIHDPRSTTFTIFPETASPLSFTANYARPPMPSGRISLACNLPNHNIIDQNASAHRLRLRCRLQISQVSTASPAAILLLRSVYISRGYYSPSPLHNVF